MDAVLVRAVETLDGAGVVYALMGGLASAAMGRARHTHDVDLFVTRADADRALDVLAAAGFRIERTNPEWLYKAFWDETMVDVIFASKGGIEFDDEMRGRRRPIAVDGRDVQMLSPEDLFVIKSLANAEHVPRHWFDGVALVAAGGIDWAYLVRRARPYAARVLSLLLYARSEGHAVPADALRELAEAALPAPATTPEDEATHHLEARLTQALATDPRVNEPHLTVTVAGGDVLVTGKVATSARRQAVQAVLVELVPELAGDARLRNEVGVLDE